jgi:hypothetical protein
VRLDTIHLKRFNIHILHFDIKKLQVGAASYTLGSTFSSNFEKKDSVKSTKITVLTSTLNAIRCSTLTPKIMLAKYVQQVAGGWCVANRHC